MARILVAVAWPYASGPRHIGHAAGAYIPADIFARYQRMAGNDVLMVSGSDMHGTPVTVRAEEEGVPPEEVAERYHALHVENFEALGVVFDLYWKTSAPRHAAVVQDLFRTLREKGHVYEEAMDASWCPSCERFRPDRYVEGACPHCGYATARGDQCEQCGRMLDPFDLQDPHCQVCGTPIERRETRHFFFRLSAFQEPLEAWLKKQGHWRAHVRNFALAWLKEGLRDRPVTRDIDWGIPLPWEGYAGKRIYVWFEAFIGYLSASIEWARRQGDLDLWRAWWYDPEVPHYYFVGKDNIVFHTIFWPAVLMGYDEQLRLPYDVPANQYMNLGGEKMSAGRAVGAWLRDLLEEYDPDALRYYVAAAMPESRDTEFTYEELARRVNTELVAVYGNFVHRVLSFTHNQFGHVPEAGPLDDVDRAALRDVEAAWRTAGQNLNYCHFKNGLEAIMGLARQGNRYFDAKAPWELVRTDREACGTALRVALRMVKALAVLTAPYLPFSADRVWTMLGHTGSVHDATWGDALEDLASGQELATPVPLYDTIDLESPDLAGEADRLDVRVGVVTSVEDHPDADKLFLVDVDLGDESRRVVAGMRQAYRAEEIDGKHAVVLCNLKPATFRGVRSDAMLLAAVEGETIALLLAGGAGAGARVLGTADAPELSYEEFRALKIRVGEDGHVYFQGTADTDGVLLEVGGEPVRLDRPVSPGSEVT